MAEPPPKRPRRTDSAAMWDQPRDSRPDRRDRDRGDTRDRLYRERPRSREHDREPRDGRDTRDTKDGRERRRSRSRERGGRRARGGRERSRSPGDRRTPVRQRSPMRTRSPGKGRSPVRQRSPGRARSPARARSPPRGPRPDRGGKDKPAPKVVPLKGKAGGELKKEEDKMEVDLPEGLELTPEELTMMKTMGFLNFKTTKNTKVPGNDRNYGVRKEKKAEYRQYMNRTGGFNRPLSPG
ncbi:DUF1777-domain-containing protein [Trichodelitschia bisporula]|uniref:DUF1777-domain-containing protein n=1 Tax=Trichodelitschia bisporula TaxID=703511 RepID=A0A6G1HN34_9PEZI|nr:DUF1777-domain-containing protein [Trichodelitschia bisporula]